MRGSEPGGSRGAERPSRTLPHRAPQRASSSATETATCTRWRLFIPPARTVADYNVLHGRSISGSDPTSRRDPGRPRLGSLRPAPARQRADRPVPIRLLGQTPFPRGRHQHAWARPRGRCPSLQLPRIPPPPGPRTAEAVSTAHQGRALGPGQGPAQLRRQRRLPRGARSGDARAARAAEKLRRRRPAAGPDRAPRRLAPHRLALDGAPAARQRRRCLQREQVLRATSDPRASPSPRTPYTAT